MDPKKASSLSGQTKKVKRYFYIAEAFKNDPRVSLLKLCRTFNVSRSGYYNWLNRLENLKDNDSLLLVRTVFEARKSKAGIRTIKMILQRDYKVVMNLKKISRIKKLYGLETIIRRRNKYRYVSKGGADHQAAPNLVNRNFDIKSNDQVYSTDITYLNYGNGQRAYLSAVKDLGSKEIVHFTVCKNIHMEIATDGLDILFGKLSSRKRKNLVVHSDQGTHYTNKSYREKLRKFGVMQSMSRKGNCLDNAPIESFFGHLKDEVDLKKCRRYEELVSNVSKYIDYYNNHRPQWGLERKTPAECRRF